jgi:hypothetical protein
MKTLKALFKIFPYLSLVLCGFVYFCQAEEGEVCLGDSGKCGRDCIYYVCHRSGQQATLAEIDQQLSGRKNITFSDIRQALETRGFFCQSYLFNARNIGSLQKNLNQSGTPLYAIAALPSSTETGHHFVVIEKSVGSHITIYDVSNNKSGTFDVANFRGQQVIIPVLLVSQQAIHFQTLFHFETIPVLLGVVLSVIILFLCYQFVTLGRLKRFCLGPIHRTKQRFSQLFTYRRLVILGCLIVFFFLLGLIYREYNFNKHPLKLLNPNINLGEIELFKKNEFYFEIKNRSLWDIPIEEIQVSCHCLKIESFPEMIQSKSNEKIKISLIPLLEGNVSYQTLIVPQNNSPILGKISYDGYQHVRLLPKYYHVGIIEQGNQKEFVCEFSIKDLREESLEVTSFRMQGDDPIFEILGKTSIRIKKDETFSIKIKHLGNAPAGNFLQALEIKGKGTNNEDEIILLTNIVGYVSREK